MRFDIISIFPESFTAYFGVSMLKRAQEDGLIEIHTHSLRDFTHDKHKTVDDTPYGGGAGMLLKAGPLAEALESVNNQQSTINSQRKTKNKALKTRTILLSAKGNTFTQKDARRLAQYERLILVCGRYEGVDEREAESHTSPGVVEYPQYTKPETFRGWRVPEVLISGHHGEIAKWKEEQSKKMSQRRKRMIR